MRLRAHDLACDIDGHRILTGIDGEFPAGAVTAVVGVNGCGKSTLLRALAGIRPPAWGTVTLDGVPLSDLPARVRARRVAFVGQEEHPPEDLLVGEMLALGRTPHSRPWDHGGAAERRAVLDALDLVGLTHAVDRPCHALSGGERRRALLARGLVQDCPVLFLDEPTNHLDIAHQHHLLKVVRNLGRTVVMAIHDLDLADRYADHVVVLHDGGVLNTGSPRDVLVDAVVGPAFGMRVARLADPLTGESHLVTTPRPTAA